MTKKHYEAIADIINLSLKLNGYNPNTYNGMTDKDTAKGTILFMMSKFADSFENENVKFNRHMFIDRCKSMS